jgi:flagellar operon protein
MIDIKTATPVGRVGEAPVNRPAVTNREPGFQAELERALQPAATKDLARAAAAAQPLKFSAHAIERMRSRGIHFPAEQMAKVESAIQKAAQKGARDTLVIAGDQALIVSVKNNTVVTVMDRQSMKENVFTNIDSTVMV